MFKKESVKNVLFRLVEIATLHPELSFDLRDLKVINFQELSTLNGIHEASVSKLKGNDAYFLGEGDYEGEKLQDLQNVSSHYLLLKTKKDNFFGFLIGEEDREIDPRDSKSQGYIVVTLTDKIVKFKDGNFTLELLNELRNYFFNGSKKYYQSIAYNILSLWRNIDSGAFSSFSDEENSLFIHPMNGFKHLSDQNNPSADIAAFFDRQFIGPEDNYCFYQIYFAKNKWFIFSHSPLHCYFYRIDEEIMEIHYLSHGHRLCELRDFFSSQIMREIDRFLSPISDEFDATVICEQ